MGQITAAEAVDAIQERFGRHAGHRALHAKGRFCRGTFVAQPAARELTRAAFLQGDEVPVLVRLSNGGGNPHVSDTAPDVRGLAASFELPDGSRTDIVAQSVPRFPVKTPEEFIDLVRLNARTPANAIRFPLWIAQRPAALLGLPANAAALRPPVSFATSRYFGVHAFRWLDAGGGARHVRYTWIPEAGEHRLAPWAARGRGRDYLAEELAERLATGPVAFTLQVQVAADGDAIGDPSAQWPSSRRRVDVGTLTVHELLDDPEADGKTVHVFDPTRVTDGIELSDDPVLQFRAGAYSVSVERRLSARGQ